MQLTTLDNPTSKFWDSIAPKYAQQRIADPVAYKAKLSRVRALLSATDRVLEIGCGTGSTALALAPHVARITATDISRGMINIAQSKLGPNAPSNINFRQADAADLIEGHPFDVVCAFSLLHLIEDVPKVLERVRAQLKPGGLLTTKTECLKNRSAVTRGFVAALTAVGMAPRVTLLSDNDLHRHLRTAGFVIEQSTYLGASHSNPFIVARRADA
jgi:ubiquinone/menaquinone biosynthesis C-methylase UbiE